ncbi:hypothetical protein KAI87_01865 [Myxococcota bacterium]|nr:hypothetical protein [Myxococcota bacterium]
MIRLFKANSEGKFKGQSVGELVQWIKTVARNQVNNLHRSKEVKATFPAVRVSINSDDAEFFAYEYKLASVAANFKDSSDDVEGRYDSRQLIQQGLDALKSDYPQGYQLLVCEYRFPRATSAELAKELGISKANFYKIRQRKNKILGDVRKKTSKIIRN